MQSIGPEQKKAVFVEFNVQWLPSQVLNGSFLDLCFVNEVQWNNGAHAGA